MKILITGGGGYKGLKLAKALLEQRHEVTLLDNYLYGEECAFFLFDYPAANFVRQDIRSLTPADVAAYDCVYHLAAISGYPACEANPHAAESINVDGTQRLLDCLGEQQLLVYASTTSIYGKADAECDEDSPVYPASLYARTKYRAEQLCRERKHTVVFRFATLFGVSPRMRWDLLVNDFVMRAVHERSLILFDPESTRTFLHLDDAIRAYVMAVAAPDTFIGRVFNVGDAALNLSKRRLAEKIREHVDYDILISELADLDVRNFLIRFDRLTDLGFQPQRTLDCGIAELVKLYSFFRPHQPYRVI